MKEQKTWNCVSYLHVGLAIAAESSQQLTAQACSTHRMPRQQINREYSSIPLLLSDKYHKGKITKMRRSLLEIHKVDKNPANGTKQATGYLATISTSVDTVTLLLLLLRHEVLEESGRRGDDERERRQRVRE
jgi:hypothetical protein